MYFLRTLAFICIIIGCSPYCNAQCDQCRTEYSSDDCPLFKQRLDCIEKDNLCKGPDKEEIRDEILSDPEYCPDLPNGQCIFGEGNKCVKDVDYWFRPSAKRCQKLDRIYRSVMACLQTVKQMCPSKSIDTFIDEILFMKNACIKFTDA